MLKKQKGGWCGWCGVKVGVCLEITLERKLIMKRLLNPWVLLSVSWEAAGKLFYLGCDMISYRL